MSLDSADIEIASEVADELVTRGQVAGAEAVRACVAAAQAQLALPRRSRQPWTEIDEPLAKIGVPTAACPHLNEIANCPSCQRDALDWAIGRLLQRALPTKWLDALPLHLLATVEASRKRNDSPRAA